VAREVAQARLVVQPEPAVLLHQPLVGAQARRAAGVTRLHLLAVEVRVAGVEEPAALRFDRDSGVAERVPGERDEQDPGRNAGELAHALEAEPGLSLRA